MYNRIQKPIETVPGIPLMYVDDLEDTSDFIPTFQSELRKEIVSTEMEYNNSQTGVAALLENWHGHFGMLRRELRKTHPRALPLFQEPFNFQPLWKPYPRSVDQNTPETFPEMPMVPALPDVLTKTSLQRSRIDWSQYENTELLEVL